MYVIWCLQIWLKLHGKWGILLVRNSSIFDVPNGLVMGIFSTKLSGNHIDTYYSKLEYSNMELGLFEKITFFPPDPLLMWMGEAV
jgi:hypothetical protein